MGTVKVTQTGDDKYDVEDADGEIHSALSAEEVAEFTGTEAAEIPAQIAAGQGGVGYFEVEDADEVSYEDDDDEDSEEESKKE